VVGLILSDPQEGNGKEKSADDGAYIRFFAATKTISLSAATVFSNFHIIFREGDLLIGIPCAAGA